MGAGFNLKGWGGGVYIRSTWEAHRMQAKTQEETNVRGGKPSGIQGHYLPNSITNLSLHLICSLITTDQLLLSVYTAEGEGGSGWTRFHINLCTHRAGDQPCKKNSLLSALWPNSKFRGKDWLPRLSQVSTVIQFAKSRWLGLWGLWKGGVI